MEIKLLDDYTIYTFDTELGRGTYGLIYRIKNNLKVFKLFKYHSSVFLSHDFMKELSAYNSLFSNVFASEILVDVHREKFGFAMIKYTTDLSKLLKGKLDMETIIYILYVLVFILAKAQNHFILHRDLKPSNILVSINDKNQIVKVDIIDWGLSRFFYSKKLKDNFNYVQTLWYRSPEQILKFNTDNASLDMWSVGIIALELIKGYHGVFNCQKSNDQLQRYIYTFYDPDNSVFIEACKKYEKIKGVYLKYEKKYTIPLCENPVLNDFIKSCLNIDPDKRIDPIAASNHELFNKYTKFQSEPNLKTRITNIRSLHIDYSSLIDNITYISKRKALIDMAVKIIKKLNWSIHELSRIMRIFDKCMEYIYYFDYDISHYLLVIIGLMYDDITCSSKCMNIALLASYINVTPPTYVIIKNISKNILTCVSYTMYFKTFMMYDMLLKIDASVQNAYLLLCTNTIYNIKTLLYDDVIIFGTIIKKLRDKYGDKISTKYEFEHSDELMEILHNHI